MAFPFGVIYPGPIDLSLLVHACCLLRALDVVLNFLLPWHISAFHHPGHSPSPEFPGNYAFDFFPLPLPSRFFPNRGAVVLSKMLLCSVSVKLSFEIGRASGLARVVLLFLQFF